MKTSQIGRYFIRRAGLDRTKPPSPERRILAYARRCCFDHLGTDFIENGLNHVQLWSRGKGREGLEREGIGDEVKRREEGNRG